MNDDLHNIDDLFREGLEEHREDVPSSAWDVVSNDLDKKQAALYKNKYDKLKRLALLLLLFCFVGGGICLLTMLGHKQNSIAANKPDTKNTQSVTTTTQVQQEKDEQSHSVTHTGSISKPVVQENEADGTKAPYEKTISAKKNNPDIVEQSTLSTSVHAPEKGTRSNKYIADKPFKSSTIVSVNTPKSKGIKNVYSERMSALENSSYSNKGGLNRGPIAGKSMLAKTRDANRVNASTTTSPAAAYTPPQRITSLPLRDASPLFTIAPNSSLAPSVSSMQSSQPALHKSRNIHALSLTAFVAPNINFDHLEDNGHFAGPGRNRQEAHREEQKNTSFSGGLLLNYELSRSWILHAGVSVTSSSTFISPKTVYAKADNNGHTSYELPYSSGYVYISPKGSQPVAGDSARTQRTMSKLTYVTIPVSASYHLRLARFSFLPTVGLGVNILMNGKAKTALANPASNESFSASISGLKPTYLDGHLGLGVEYSLNRKFSLSFRPNARLALTPINKETPVKSYQSFLSIESGVKINF